MTGRYKVITLCVSTRFKEQFFEAQDSLYNLLEEIDELNKE